MEIFLDCDGELERVSSQALSGVRAGGHHTRGGNAYLIIHQRLAGKEKWSDSLP